MLNRFACANAALLVAATRSAARCVARFAAAASAACSFFASALSASISLVCAIAALLIAAILSVARCRLAAAAAFSFSSRAFCAVLALSARSARSARIRRRICRFLSSKVSRLVMSVVAARRCVTSALISFSLAIWPFTVGMSCTRSSARLIMSSNHVFRCPAVTPRGPPPAAEGAVGIGGGRPAASRIASAAERPPVLTPVVIPAVSDVPIVTPTVVAWGAVVLPSPSSVACSESLRSRASPPTFPSPGMPPGMWVNGSMIFKTIWIAFDSRNRPAASSAPPIASRIGSTIASPTPSSRFPIALISAIHSRTSAGNALIRKFPSATARPPNPSRSPSITAFPTFCQSTPFTNSVSGPTTLRNLSPSVAPTRAKSIAVNAATNESRSDRAIRCVSVHSRSQSIRLNASRSWSAAEVAAWLTVSQTTVSFACTVRAAVSRVTNRFTDSSALVNAGATDATIEPPRLRNNSRTRFSSPGIDFPISRAELPNSVVSSPRITRCASIVSPTFANPLICAICAAVNWTPIRCSLA